MTVPPTDVTLSNACPICSSMSNLQRCSRCKVIHYCSREHQSSHFPTHKSACNDVRKARDHIDAEKEELLRIAGADFFETHGGHFWGLIETRDYMRARYGFVEALMEVKSTDSAQTQLEHLMDMLRLCRSDNMGVRYLVPAVMVRLDKDQEAYDLVKWYSTTGNDETYDWGDMSRPFLDVKDGMSSKTSSICARTMLLTFHTSLPSYSSRSN